MPFAERERLLVHNLHVHSIITGYIFSFPRVHLAGKRAKDKIPRLSAPLILPSRYRLITACSRNQARISHLLRKTGARNVPGHELMLPDNTHPAPFPLAANLATVLPPMPATFSSLATASNTPQQPEILMLKFADVVAPSASALQLQQNEQLHASMEQWSVTEALNKALLTRKEDDPLAVVRSVLEEYPELPAGKRGEIGANFFLEQRIAPSAESMAEAFGISTALLYRKMTILSPPSEELQAWVDSYMVQQHPGKRPAELDIDAKVQLTRCYFNHTNPAFCTPFLKLAALLGISEYRLRNKIRKQLAAESAQRPPGESQPAVSATEKKVRDCSLYRDKEKHLQNTLNQQLAQEYPGQTMLQLSAEERLKLAISYWQEQTVKPSLMKLAALTLTPRMHLANEVQKIKKVPPKLVKWVESQRRQLPQHLQMQYDCDKTLRLELALTFWERMPPELCAQKDQLACVMNIRLSSFLTKYRRLHLIPAAVVSRVKDVLAQRCIALKKTSLSNEEKTQTAAALWLNELSSQVAEKALARLLAIEHQQLHEAITDLRSQSRLQTAAMKRKAVTPPTESAEMRSVSPEPLDISNTGKPRKNQKNSVKKILKHLGLKAIQALPVSRKKTIRHKHIQATAPGALPAIKLEPVTLPQPAGVELVICGDNGEVINSFATAQRPLKESFALRNDLPILRDPLHPEKSLTLQAEGVTSAQQLDVIYWGDLKKFAKNRPKTQIDNIVQQAREMVAMEGPQLAACMERLMICHESFAEDETGAIQALGQGVFNGSGQTVAEGTVLGIVAGDFIPGDNTLSLARKQGSRNSLSHTWNSGSWQNTVNSFHNRNLLAMVNSGKLPGKPALAENNVGLFILGREGNLICYFTTKPVAPGAEYYIDYSEQYDPDIVIKYNQQEERVEATIQRVLYPHQIKPEPEASHEPLPATAAGSQPFPYTEQLIRNIYHPHGWREKSCEALPLLISRTRAFVDAQAVLVIVDEKYQFTLALDSVSHQLLTPQQLHGRKLAVIQHVGGSGNTSHYQALLPRAGKQNAQFLQMNGEESYSLVYTSCHTINIPPSGFCLTHAAWVALTGKTDDPTQGGRLRHQLVDIIQSGAYEELIRFNAQHAEAIKS